MNGQNNILMLYNINTFSNEFDNNYPVFLNMVQKTYLYYSYPESILSILFGTREYNIAHHIMKEILNSFYDNYQNKTVISNNIGLNHITLECFLQINEKLSTLLQKYYDASYFAALKFYNSLNIEVKLNTHRQIIVTILDTPKAPNINNYNKTSSYVYDFHEIANNILLFYYLVKFYEMLFIKDNNLGLKHVNNKEVFVSEFFMFLSHFTFSYMVDRKEYSEEKLQNNAIHFVLNNLQRAINHLERGILDILKIIISSVITSKDIDTDKIGQLLAIRQSEFFLLSQDTEKRAHSYIIWLKDLEIYKDNKHIQKIIEDICNHLGSKI